MVFGAPGSGAAQIPSEFTNLTLLPDDISQARLVGVMRGFAGALGTNCGYCHVGEDPATLENFDFASDEKETKRIARTMFEMVRSINEEHLPQIGREDRTEVTCNTCHHGYNKPADLRDELMSAHDDGGMDAVRARYDELREAYFGRAVFDFGEGTLTSFSERLVGKGEGEDGVSVLEMNLEFFPESQSVWWQLGQTLEATGDLEGALSAYRNGLTTDPASGFSQFFLERIDALGG
jgi:hypothetical protein